MRMPNQKMYQRWAKIFLEIHDKSGCAAAKKWADRTINPEDTTEIQKEIIRMRGGKK